MKIVHGMSTMLFDFSATPNTHLHNRDKSSGLRWARKKSADNGEKHIKVYFEWASLRLHRDLNNNYTEYALQIRG